MMSWTNGGQIGFCGTGPGTGHDTLYYLDQFGILKACKDIQIQIFELLLKEKTQKTADIQSVSATSAMQPNLSVSLRENTSGVSWANISTFMTREAEAKIMSIFMATFHRGLMLGYTCYQKANAAFSTAPPIHVLPVGFVMVIPLAKNKSLEASRMLVAC